MAWGLRNISARELAEWQAYHGLEPLGERRADYRNALLASIIANVNRGADTDAYPISDFLPAAMPEDEAEDEAEDDAPDESWREQITVAEMITAAYGGQDKRN